MAKSPTHNVELPAGPANLADQVCLKRWFAFYILFLALACGLAAMLLAQQTPEFHRTWQGLGQFTSAGFWGKFKELGLEMRGLIVEASPGLKLVLLVIYLAISTTFLPLPTGAMIAAVATKRMAMGASPALLAAELCLLGAMASTIANLTDLHVYLWLLRNKKIAKVRDTRVFRWAAKWFGQKPFWIMTVVNILPIPADVPLRMLCAVYGYPRVPFAASNFIGRLLRYMVIVLLIIMIGEKYDWLAPVVLLGLAVAVGLLKIIPALWRKLRGKQAKTVDVAAAAGDARPGQNP
jgi:membrane protein YqaA with SNARE-associated domain